MKPVPLLNGIIAIAFVVGFVDWWIGIYRQHNGATGGWPIYLFMLCWGIIGTMMAAKGILQGRLGNAQGRGSASREQNPVQFWIWVGMLFVVGIVVSIIGAFKMIIRLL
jgi:hypothetical protein